MAKTKLLNNIEALNEAIFQAMETDENVVLWGEDSGYEGGVFRATKDLQKTFGLERVWDAPIAEATYTGVGIGAAIYGLKPIVELQFQGFSLPSFQQLFAHAARIRNRSRSRFTVPMVVRMPMGGGVRALEHHSEAIEAIFGHVPGLKVVMPSTPYDTKGLMLAAIKDPDPVIFLEPKKMYRAFKQEVPTEQYEIEIGKANVIKEGSDLTLVTYGAQVQDSIKAVQELMQSGATVDVEIIDLRTISPLDTETIVNSVKKTGRLLIVHEAVKSFSVSAEIVSRVNEDSEAFTSLLAPPTRLTGFDITVPLSTGEKYHHITPAKIVKTIKKVMNFAY